MDSEPIQRKKAGFNHSDKFIVKDKVFTQQYAGLYFTRLNLMRPRILKSASQQWDSSKIH